MTSFINDRGKKPQGSPVVLTTDVSGVLPVANGGSGAATLTGLLQGNGTSPFTGITNSSTVGQVLRVTGAATYAWGALDLADTDAVTGTLPVGNGGTGITSLGTGVATWLGTPSSANLAAALTDETGTGLAVFNNGPTFVDTIGVGNATASSSGSGITFPATQDASTDANTLDDYEEGTWTPVDASAGSLTFADPAGTYEKIGRQITARCTYTYPVTADGNPNVMGGLPFTVPNTAEARSSWLTISTETTAQFWAISNNTTQAAVFSAGAAAQLSNATLSGDPVRGTAIYYV